MLAVLALMLVLVLLLQVDVVVLMLGQPQWCLLIRDLKLRTQRTLMPAVDGCERLPRGPDAQAIQEARAVNVV